MKAATRARIIECLRRVFGAERDALAGTQPRWSREWTEPQVGDRVQKVETVAGQPDGFGRWARFLSWSGFGPRVTHHLEYKRGSVIEEDFQFHGPGRLVFVRWDSQPDKPEWVQERAVWVEDIVDSLARLAEVP